MCTNKLLSEMLSHADESQVAGLMRFFKCGKGEYGEDDRFLGIKVPVTCAVVKECWRMTDFTQLEECIASPFHEVRLAALLALIEIFNHARGDESMRQKCIDFYLAHTAQINNWDLVDLSCYKLLGEWLVDRERSLLYELARNGATLWEQRIGMVSTMQFIRRGELDDTYAIAEIFLNKPQPLHDLLQKAVGWLLREAGKKDEPRLVAWLQESVATPAAATVPRAATMPRTMLRYAIERLPQPLRQQLLEK
ncbi:MAG: DNA alkylation repair protein [Muribaculaceae bacterium]